jgi:hypothetical protein
VDLQTDHFRLDCEFIEPISEIGHVTVRLLRLNGVYGCPRYSITTSVMSSACGALSVNAATAL